MREKDEAKLKSLVGVMLEALREARDYLENAPDAGKQTATVTGAIVCAEELRHIWLDRRGADEQEDTDEVPVP